jgi:hypothetical protein
MVPCASTVENRSRSTWPEVDGTCLGYLRKLARASNFPGLMVVASAPNEIRYTGPGSGERKQLPGSLWISSQTELVAGSVNVTEVKYAIVPSKRVSPLTVWTSVFPAPQEHETRRARHRLAGRSTPSPL